MSGALATHRPPERTADLIAALSAAVPVALRARAQWVSWRHLTRGGKPAKVPFDARTGAAADSTDPSTWSTFAEALVAWQGDARNAGVGYVFSAEDPYCGVDLDDCIDPLTGDVLPWGRALIDRLDSYGEVSPSDTGVKVIAEGVKPGPRCKARHASGAVEMYDRDRFFTITGRRLPGSPTDPRPAQAAIDAIYEQVFRPTPRDAPRSDAQPAGTGLAPVAASPGAYALTDEEILKKAASARKGGPKFAALWAGRWDAHFGSQSEADSSTIFTLAFYTKDAAQLDRLFRQGGLMRDKWDERHGQQTYGAMTVAKALAKVTAQYRPRRPSQRSAVVKTSVATRGLDPDAANGCEASEESCDADGRSGGEGSGDGAPRDAEGLIALGGCDPETGRLVLSPRRTLPTARAFVARFHAHPDGRTLHRYAGSTLAWKGNRYVEVEEGALRQRLQPWLHDALRYQYNKQHRRVEFVDFESNPSTVGAALESVNALVHLPAAIAPAAWLDRQSDGQVDRPDPDRPGADLASPDRPDPRGLLPFPTGTLDVASGRVLAPTPLLFNLNAIDFDYDLDAEPPEHWTRFLEQLWGDDLESVRLLQEWMGYSLVADTSQQKMLLMVGPRRSGKGTVGRVMSRLVGAGNVVGPTTSGLAGPFGLQPLIGKSLAIVSDARFSGENVGVVVERLLCVSGEDALTVERKFLGALTMKLPTRFVFLTNELPRMNDASGALAGRFVILRLTRSFYGHEDVGLGGRLAGELPGILLWAIEGLKRLRARGHFVQPQAVVDAVRDLEDLASPVGAFVRDCCEVGAGRRAWVDELYGAWKGWCERDGRVLVTHKQTFGRDLAAAVPGVVCRRHSIQGRFYEGIALGAGGVP